MIKFFLHKFKGLLVSYYRLNSLYSSINSKERILSEIIQSYHVLEKGLTMPNKKLGFGIENNLRLCRLIEEYCSLGDFNTNQIEYAINALKEYKDIHLYNNFKINSELENAIDKILEIFPNVKIHRQYKFDKNSFFKASDMGFYEFSHGRHTCRHFNGEISDNLVIKALSLAQETTPSACNRQSIKIKYIKDKVIIREILKIQKGNRGFGHNIDKIIVLTSDMSYWNYTTSIGGYIDGGIYLMNLLYSLYFYKIGSCTLNCYFNKSNDIKVRSIIKLPVNEVFISIIGVGNVSDSIEVARSGRKELEEVLMII